MIPDVLAATMLGFLTFLAWWILAKSAILILGTLAPTNPIVRALGALA